MVHNRPQWDVAAEVAAVVARSAESREEITPATTTTVRTRPPQQRPVVDTSGFTRTELPPVLPPTKRSTTRRLAPPEKPVSRPVPPASPKSGPIPPRPAPVNLNPQLISPPPMLPATTGSRRQIPTTNAQPPLTPLGPRRAGISRRTGKPRNALELLKRLLDWGCTYERQPESAWGTVRYRGRHLASIHCADSTAGAVVLQDYRVCRAKIWAIKNPELAQQRALERALERGGDPERRVTPSTSPPQGTRTEDR